MRSGRWGPYRQASPHRPGARSARRGDRPHPRRPLSEETTVNPRTQLRIEPLEGREVPATMLVPDLAVSPVATGLVAPTTMAFLGANDFLVLEKISGKVQRVTDGA